MTFIQQTQNNVPKENVYLGFNIPRIIQSQVTDTPLDFAEFKRIWRGHVAMRQMLVELTFLIN